MNDIKFTIGNLYDMSRAYHDELFERKMKNWRKKESVLRNKHLKEETKQKKLKGINEYITYLDNELDKVSSIQKEVWNYLHDDYSNANKQIEINLHIIGDKFNV